MKSKLNIKSARELVQIYREITVEKILGTFATAPGRLPTALTNFGSSLRCILCVEAREIRRDVSDDRDVSDNWGGSFCKYCIHSGKCTQHETYQGIANAKTAQELQRAYRRRANFIEKICNTLERDENG